MLVAPTELRHPAFRALTRANKGSNKPEHMGVDFAFNHQGAWYGVQRKEIKDFVASVNDGRLRKEVQQMVVLEKAMLIVEGQPRWSFDGTLLGDNFGSGWDRTRHVKMLLSLQDANVWVLGTGDTADTARAILDFEAWVKKGEHFSLKGRGGTMATPWGTKANRDYQIHLISGLPGVDYVLAMRILDDIGMPFGLKVTREQLLNVKGLGPKKTDKILEALESV